MVQQKHPSSTGPYRVVTQLGVYSFDPHTKRMTLIAVVHRSPVPAETRERARRSDDCSTRPELLP